MPGTRRAHLPIVLCFALCAFVIGSRSHVLAADPVEVDVILPVTGAASFIGQSEQRAFEIFEQSFNRTSSLRGRPVHFVFHDDASSAQVSVQLVNAIIAKHRAVFLGSSITGLCAATEPLVRTSGPVEYCLTPGLSPTSRSFVFAGTRSIDATNGPTVRFASDRNLRRVAVFAATDASGQAGYQAFMRAMKQYNRLTLVADEKFEPVDVSIAALAANVKAAKPDVVFIYASGPAFATVLRELNNAGIEVPVITSSANYNKDQLVQYATFLPKDLYFDGFASGAKSTNPALRKAYNDYLAAFKAADEVPTTLSSYAWDPAKIVVSVLQALGPAATADQIHTYLLGLHDFAGINGIYDLRSGDQHGLGRDSTVVVRWNPSTRDGDIVSRPGGAPL